MKIIIACSLILAILTGCRQKDKAHDLHTVRQDLLNYFDWKVGSYWVFTDTLTGKRDSLVVDESDECYGMTIDNVDYKDKCIFIFEYYDTFAVRKVWEINLSSLNDGDAVLLYYNQGYFGSGNQILTYNINPIDLKPGNVISPQMTVGSKTYTNVFNSAMLHERILLNADSGFIELDLNNFYTHKALVLQKSHIVH